MKIALISVAPPYRGGISKHTSILYQKLSKKYKVDIINYKRQYPKILFPGRSQFVKEKNKNELGIRKIDSINPISWFSTGIYLSNQNYNLIIFRIWNPFFAFALYVIARVLKFKSPHIKLISLCDNILPHESIPMGTYFTKYLFNQLDGHLVQSSKVEQELKEIVDSPIYEKRFHPVYSSYLNKIDKDIARKELNIQSNNVILYFGIIREYKGFDILIHAISKLKSKQKNFHVLVAGECYGSAQKYYKMILDFGIKKLITWHNSYIPDDDVRLYFSAADVIVLPYRSASQSGIVQLAYNYNVPVIVSNVGGLPEVVDDGKSGFIIDVDNPSQLANILNEYLGGPMFNEMSKYINNFKNKFSWDNFIKGIESIWKKI